jgi:hypothetical protein
MYSTTESDDDDDSLCYKGFGVIIKNHIVNRPAREHTAYLSTFARLACGRSSIAKCYKSQTVSDETKCELTCPKFWATAEGVRSEQLS